MLYVEWVSQFQWGTEKLQNYVQSKFVAWHKIKAGESKTLETLIKGESFVM